MDLDTMWSESREALVAAYEELVEFAIAAVEALVLVLVAVLVARALRRRARVSLADSALGPNAAALIANGVSIGVYILAAAFILGLFGADWTALLAALSVFTVAIGLAFQDVLKSFIAGVYLLLEQPFSIGDRIRVQDFEGEVEGIDIRTTVLRNDQQERVLIPNATVFAAILVNRSASRLRSTTLTIEGVTRDVSEINAAVAAALDGAAGLGKPGPEIAVKKIGSQGATVEVVVWHPVNGHVDPAVIARLRELFPDATVTLAS